jgi:phosphatidylinositol alpha-mannosyltransferase
MRIGVVCPYDLGEYGGVQQLTKQLVDRLGQSGDEAILVGPGRTVKMPANRSRVPLSIDPRAFATTRRRLADVEVVHVHEPFIPVVGWAGLWKHKPVVATFHADPARWTRLLYRLGTLPGRAWLGDAVLTAVSEVAASALPERWGSVEIVPNAIDVPSYRLPVPRDPNRVIFLGRDDPRKGLEVLLAAWPEIRAAHPEAELVVLGVTRPGSPIPGVRFLGRVDEEEKRRSLASSTVHVAPNLGGESFGLVVAEGMAAGCAVVASDIPAFRAVLGAAGRLVPPGEVAALAGAIALLLGDPATATALGEAAAASVRRFDWPKVTESYRRAYESALERHGSRIGRPKE